jgi:hypothetical protein
MTPRTQHHPTAPPRIPNLRVQWWWALVGVAAIVVFVVISHLATTSPKTIPRLAVANGSVYDLDIDVTGANRDGWTGVGTAKAHSTKEFHDVIDQGNAWVFHFAGQGQDGGELQISRKDLARKSWHIDIPDAVAQRLHSAGASPSPATPISP